MYFKNTFPYYTLISCISFKTFKMIYLIVLSAPDVVRERHGRVLSSEIWWRPDRHSDCPYISLTYSHTLRQIGSKIRTKCFVCRLSDSTTLDIITFKKSLWVKKPKHTKVTSPVHLSRPIALEKCRYYLQFSEVSFHWIADYSYFFKCFCKVPD